MNRRTFSAAALLAPLASSRGAPAAAALTVRNVRISNPP